MPSLTAVTTTQESTGLSLGQLVGLLSEQTSKLVRAELDLAKAEGLAGTVSYSKALSLLTGAKTQQQFEAYEGCTSKAERARFYIRESRAGR